MPVRVHAKISAAILIAALAAVTIGGSALAVADAWSPVGNNGNTPAITTVSGSVNALLKTDDGILLGGNFANPGGVNAGDSFALWDGSSFSAFGDDGSGNGYFNSIGDTVRAIAMHGDDIYVGGSFQDNSGDTDADNIVMWDDSASDWVALDNGLNGAVRAIVVDGNNTYVGGDFVNAGGVDEADYVAKWNGTSWSALGNVGNQGALGDHVNALVMKNGTLFAGGLFTNADAEDKADYVAKWTGSAWTNLGANGNNGSLNGEVLTLLVDGSDLLVGGVFTTLNGNADGAHVAKWASSSWSDFNTNGVIGNNVFALAVDGGDLYAGGVFAEVGGPLDRIGKWDGSSWTNLDDNGGNGAIGNNSVLALAMLDRDLFVGGSFTDVMGEAESDYFVSWGLQPEYKPDGRVRAGNSGAWTGNNIYNTTGSSQKITQTGKKNALKRFQISVQNDSPTETEVLYVKADAGSTAKFTITYLDGATDITNDVLSLNGWDTPVALAPGDTYIIDVEVQYNNASAGSKVTRLITITSDGNAAKQDAVKIVAKR